jgi:ABC-2 type transport system ATP-binding protein
MSNHRKPILSARNLYKKYSRNFSISDVSIDVTARECVVLVGHNGAGKTSLLRMLTGLVSPDRGDLVSGDRYIDRLSLARLVGFVQQQKEVPEDLSPREYLNHQAKLRGAKDVNLDSLFCFAGLGELDKQRMGVLSGGSKRKVHILSAMLHSPKVLVMDEPTVGLDPMSRKSILQYILKAKNNGMGVLVSTHHLDEAEYLGDTLAIMHSGKLLGYGEKEDVSKKIGMRFGIDVEFPTLHLPQEQVLITLLNQLSWASTVEKIDLGMRIVTENDEREMLPLLSQILAENSLFPSCIKTYQPTLDDILQSVVA